MPRVTGRRPTTQLLTWTSVGASMTRFWSVLAARRGRLESRSGYDGRSVPMMGVVEEEGGGKGKRLG